jgi:Uncharacterized protein conserved in bacteria (DUF2252)
MSEASVPRRSARAVPDAKVAAEYDAAWKAGLPPQGPVWTARPWVDPAARATEGKAARAAVPRASHAAFQPAADRDPIAILAAQERRTVSQASSPCVTSGWASPPSPTTGGRRRSWPSTWRRRRTLGSPSRPAATPTSRTSASNASPERTLVFDANDFDETLPGPWEWDVKRLAASIIIAGRANGFGAGQNRAATMATVRSYRQ